MEKEPDTFQLTEAAGKSANGKGKKPAVTFKGFGAVPAKLETRVPESDTELCECKSGK